MDRTPITHVAIRFQVPGTEQKQVFSLPKPNRHHDVIRMIVEQTGVATVQAPEEDQGFLDQSGRFLNRRQALVSAQLNDQLLPGRDILLGRLYSENLW